MKTKYLHNKKFVTVSILSVLLVKEVIQNFTLILHANPALLTHRHNNVEGEIKRSSRAGLGFYINYGE
ncbi:MAG: hypothetical protein ACYCS0_05305 [bacterium]